MIGLKESLIFLAVCVAITVVWTIVLIIRKKK
jgi:hypothetical protein